MTDTATPAVESLESMTVKALRDLASSNFPQIKGISGLNKAPLIAAIQDAMGTTPVPAAKKPGKAAKQSESSAPVSIPSFAKDACPATTPTGQVKAELKFLRDFKMETKDNATRTAVRKQMKRLKKRTRRARSAAGTPAEAPGTDK